MSSRHIMRAVLAVAAGMVGGCYEMAWYYPAPGQGSMVSNGERLGIAQRLSEGTPDAQSFLVVCVREAYTADAGPGLNRTIVQVTVNVNNQAAAPARLDVKKTQIELGGRVFTAPWVYRSGGMGRDVPKEGRNEVAPNQYGRFDLFFDMGQYPSRAAYVTVPPMTGGIPLAAIREFAVSWSAEWAGKPVSGKVKFFRDYTGGVGGGWTVAPGPLWGWGWWGWSYPWPSGGVIIRPQYPWRPGPSPLKPPIPAKLPKLSL